MRHESLSFVNRQEFDYILSFIETMLTNEMS